jgi:hypothetical protein
MYENKSPPEDATPKSSSLLRQPVFSLLCLAFYVYGEIKLHLYVVININGMLYKSFYDFFLTK